MVDETNVVKNIQEGYTVDLSRSATGRCDRNRFVERRHHRIHAEKLQVVEGR